MIKSYVLSLKVSNLLMISPEKILAQEKRMLALGIREEDLVEKFITGSGSGGQKINKTSSCVYLKHEPTGQEVKCQRERSRELNRYLARKELCDRLDQIQNGAISKRQQEIEKIRRQKRQKSRKQKQRMVADKRKLSEKKQQRRVTGSE
jgi:protein subunit release factor B